MAGGSSAGTLHPEAASVQERWWRPVWKGVSHFWLRGLYSSLCSFAGHLESEIAGVNLAHCSVDPSLALEVDGAIAGCGHDI